MKHIVTVTISNPAHEHVSLRRRQSQTNYMVEARDEAEAIFRASNHFRKLGNYVHNAVIAEQTLKEEVEQIDEANDSAASQYPNMHGPKPDMDWYHANKHNPVRVETRNTSGMGGQPVGTFTVKHFEKKSPTSSKAEFTIRHRGQHVTAEEDLDNPIVNRKFKHENAFQFYSGSEPITATQAHNLMHVKKTDAKNAKKPTNEEVEQIDEALDHEVNKYAKHMLNAHSAEDLHVGNDHRQEAHNTLKHIKNHYGPVGVRWAEARAGEHIENHNKAQRDAEKVSVMKNYKPTPPGAKVYQYPKSEVKEEVEQINEIGDTPEGRKKLAAYVKNAAKEYGRDKQLVGRESGMVANARPEVKLKLKNRITGIGRAADRLAEEEVEQIDELSQKLLRRYGGKAIRAHLDAKARGDIKTAMKRAKGTNLASAKAFPDSYKPGEYGSAKVPATNEEVEQIDEANKENKKKKNAYVSDIIKSKIHPSLLPSLKYGRRALKNEEAKKRQVEPPAWAMASDERVIRKRVRKPGEERQERPGSFNKFGNWVPGPGKQNENVENVSEKAPPGAKYERMVQDIKAEYSADGTLTPKEKAIAYATAWKAKNSGK